MVSYLFTAKYQTQNNHNFPPSSNGIVERFHRQLKNSLRPGLASSNWFEHLPSVLLGLCALPREYSATSASEAVYGSELVLPHQLLAVKYPLSNHFYEDLRNSMSGFRPVTIFRQLQISWSSYRPFSCPALWFLCVRMDIFLL